MYDIKFKILFLPYLFCVHTKKRGTAASLIYILTLMLPSLFYKYFFTGEINLLFYAHSLY
nr:MAG TPA: hypothetical protein [Caudoviricetes sp.]